MSNKTKTTLVIGDFQAGKTTGTVAQALENIKNESNTINIFVASGTNDQKRNQELTLKKELEKQNINLYQNIITGRDQIEQFSLIVRKLGRPYQEYPIISCIAHIDSLLEVKGLITDIATKFKNNFSFLGRIFFTLGFFPRGKAKSPKYVKPPETILKEDLISQLKTAKNNINNIIDLDKNAYFKHPIFGNINKKRVTKFLKLHTNHHLKIVRDILK